MPLGQFCVADNCGDCSKKTVKDANGVTLCAPAGTPADANCVVPPVCVCKGQSGCNEPCDGVTCGAGQTCTNYGPNAGKCVTNNCYNAPCLGCGKVCHLGACVDNPCKPDSCPAGQVCKPKGDYTGFDCVDSCAGKSCGANEVCKNGQCVATCEPACAADQVCDTTQTPPACVANKCMSPTCTDGSCCDPVTGACGDCACTGVVCPAGQACQQGECVGGQGGSGGAGGAGASGSGGSGETSGSSSATGSGGAPDQSVWGLATGGGGCACELGAQGRDRQGLGLAIAALALAMARRRRRGSRAGAQEVSR
jgi:hypothetical protein